MVLDWPLPLAGKRGFGVGADFQMPRLTKMGEIFERRMNPNLFHVANGKILHID